VATQLQLNILYHIKSRKKKWDTQTQSETRYTTTFSNLIP